MNFTFYYYCDIYNNTVCAPNERTKKIMQMRDIFFVFTFSSFLFLSFFSLLCIHSSQCRSISVVVGACSNSSSRSSSYSESIVVAVVAVVVVICSSFSFRFEFAERTIRKVLVASPTRDTWILCAYLSNKKLLINIPHEANIATTIHREEKDEGKKTHRFFPFLFDRARCVRKVGENLPLNCLR